MSLRLCFFFSFSIHVITNFLNSVVVAMLVCWWLRLLDGLRLVFHVSQVGFLGLPNPLLAVGEIERLDVKGVVVGRLEQLYPTEKEH